MVRQGEVWRVSGIGATPTLFATLGAGFGTSFDIAVRPDGTALFATRETGRVERISLPPLPSTVPTLTEWAMALLAALLGGAGALYLHRRARTA